MTGWTVEADRAILPLVRSREVCWPGGWKSILRSDMATLRGGLLCFCWPR